MATRKLCFLSASHLVDRVIPIVPVRQWVLTLPYPLRYRCAWDPRLTTEILRAFLRSLFADQRRRARRVLGVQRGHNGSVTFIQRFGSALNLTPHFHTLVLDGVYPGPSHDLGSFVPLPPPETEDVERVLAGTARRILRAFDRAAATTGYEGRGLTRQGTHDGLQVVGDGTEAMEKDTNSVSGYAVA